MFTHLGRIKSDGSHTPTVASDDNITHKIWDLSAAVPWGEGRFMLGYAKRQGNEGTGPSGRKVAAIGYDHNLSKRTDVYTVLRDDRTRAAGSSVEAKGTSYAVGVRHAF